MQRNGPNENVTAEKEDRIMEELTVAVEPVRENKCVGRVRRVGQVYRLNIVKHKEDMTSIVIEGYCWISV